MRVKPVLQVKSTVLLTSLELMRRSPFTGTPGSAHSRAVKRNRKTKLRKISNPAVEDSHLIILLFSSMINAYSCQRPGITKRSTFEGLRKVMHHALAARLNNNQHRL